jgi:hypothetical protein
MNYFNNNTNNEILARGGALDISHVLRQVYLWMTLGLLATAGTAVIVAQSGLPLMLASNPILWLVALFAEFGLVIFISARIMQLSPTTAAALFLAYAVLNGITLSFIFLAYNLGTITYAAIAAGAMFAATSMIAYATNIDLSRFGGLLLMALVGLVVASVVNMFFASSALDQLISYVGVILFVALTAYDTQRIKKLALNISVNASGSEAGLLQRVSVIGALTLYLDLINLFLFLLRIMGGRGGRR